MKKEENLYWKNILKMEVKQGKMEEQQEEQQGNQQGNQQEEQEIKKEVEKRQKHIKNKIHFLEHVQFKSLYIII